MRPNAPDTLPVRSPRTAFLDGIRGLAALYVAFNHADYAFAKFQSAVALPTWLRFCEGFFSYGSCAVAIFIVLSGYCLMIPVAKTPDLRQPGGAWTYLKRRAWRILPPYYAALVLALCSNLISVHARVHHFGGSSAVAYVYGLTPADIVTHIALVHNLFPAYMMLVDPPMWSIGLEWQIYFLLPLLLLPVLRRGGVGAMLAVGAVIWLLPDLVLPHRTVFSWNQTGYVFLFACGAAGALINFHANAHVRLPRVGGRWPLLTAGALLVVWLALGRSAAADRSGVDLVLFGLAGAALIVALADATVAQTAPGPCRWIHWALDCRPIRFLGAFSYSLYLMHFLVESRVIWVLQHLHLSDAITLVLAYSVAVPIAVAVSYGFYLAVEKPSLTSRARATGRLPAQRPEPGDDKTDLERSIAPA